MPYTPDPDLVVRRKGCATPETRAADGRLVLGGEMTWLVEGPADAVGAVQAVLTSVSVSLTPNLLEVNFGNAVGLFNVPGLGPVEVVSGKWERHHFEGMLADVMEVACALPFASGGNAALPYDRSLAEREDVLYHAFAYLRHILSENVPPEERLVPALEEILQDPHQQFQRVRERVPIELADRVDLRSLEAVLSRPAELVPARGTAAAFLPVAAALQGHIPLLVEQARVVSTYDTPENRFVKAFLEQALGIVSRLQAVMAETNSPFAERLRAECDGMERALRPISRSVFWTQIGRLTHLPSQSTVLQRRRGYRHVYRHFVRLRLAAHVPLPPRTVRTVLEARDIAELYELWCYFTLVRLLTDLLGTPTYAGTPAAGDLDYTVPRGLSVRWEDGTALSYNLRFARTGLTVHRSYSVPLRPDIALEIPKGPNCGLHLLDAKFKLDQFGALVADDDATEEAEERRGTFKRGDLYKMHTYRDAIPRARSVWILYPGSETRFFGADGTSALPGSLITLPEKLEGVGGLPFLPNRAGADHAAVALLLRRLTNLSASDGAAST